MFGNSLFRQFENDPFFSQHSAHMQRMDAMMNNMFSANPFMSGRSQQQSIQDQPDRPRNDRRAGANAMMPFGGSMFGGFPMFDRNMGQMMSSMQNNPDCHSFSSSTVMSYSNTGDGQPKVYQAQSSTRTAPGGIKETRRQVRDSESGLDKMAVGHHIHDRGHIIERSRNRRTGDQDEQQEYLNIDEEEAPAFNEEWRSKTARFQTEQGAIRDRMRRPQHKQREIADSHHRSQRGYRDRGNRE